MYTIKLQHKYDVEVLSARTLTLAKKLLERHNGYGYITKYGKIEPVQIKVK